MDGGAWWATVHRVTKSWTRLSDFTSLHFISNREVCRRLSSAKRDTDDERPCIPSLGTGYVGSDGFNEGF